MDTLDYRIEIDDLSRKMKHEPPVIWRNKTPQEVAREQYPDENFIKKSGITPKSTRVSVDYCEVMTCYPHPESKSPVKVYGTLIGIPEKK